MIDLHDWTTPNGHKVTMFLDEAGLPCRIVPVNVPAGDQFRPDLPHLKRGGETVRAHARAKAVNSIQTVSAGSASILFGQTAATLQGL